jgi:hypothetical protein
MTQTVSRGRCARYFDISDRTLRCTFRLPLPVDGWGARFPRTQAGPFGLCTLSGMR